MTEQDSRLPRLDYQDRKIAWCPTGVFASILFSKRGEKKVPTVLQQSTLMVALRRCKNYNKKCTKRLWDEQGKGKREKVQLCRRGEVVMCGSKTEPMLNEAKTKRGKHGNMVRIWQ